MVASSGCDVESGEDHEKARTIAVTATINVAVYANQPRQPQRPDNMPTLSHGGLDRHETMSTIDS